MTFKDLGKRISTCYNSLPALIDALRDGFNEVEGGGGGGSSDIEYSTTEKKIGKWINGKDLYEKTFEFTGTISNEVNKAIDITGADYAFLYNASGINAVNAYVPLPYTHPTSANSIGLFISSDKTSVGFRCGTSIQLSYACVTIRYTKSA